MVIQEFNMPEDVGKNVRAWILFHIILIQRRLLLEDLIPSKSKGSYRYKGGNVKIQMWDIDKYQVK